MGNIFGSSITAEQISKGIDLSNKVFLITGANNGIGKETARVLYMRNAVVILASRNEQKNIEAIDDIRKEVPKSSGQLKSMTIDLNSLESVRSFVKDFENLNIPLHCLICNAGIMAPPLTYTKDNFESQFGVNHLAHFLLSYLLVPVLHNTAIETGVKSRIIYLSSRAHDHGHIDFDDLNWKTKKYLPFRAYGQSKLANLLCAAEMNKRFIEQKKEIIAVSVHPGVIKTGLTRSNLRMFVIYFLLSPFLKNIPQGAATTVYTATSPDIENEGKGGKYYLDCREYPPAIAEATDELVAAKLFDVSAELVGVESKFQ